jgi:hypothetical protein
MTDMADGALLPELPVAARAWPFPAGGLLHGNLVLEVIGLAVAAPG